MLFYLYSLKEDSLKTIIKLEINHLIIILVILPCGHAFKEALIVQWFVNIYI